MYKVSMLHSLSHPLIRFQDLPVFQSLQKEVGKGLADINVLEPESDINICTYDVCAIWYLCTTQVDNTCHTNASQFYSMTLEDLIVCDRLFHSAKKERTNPVIACTLSLFYQYKTGVTPLMSHSMYNDSQLQRKDQIGTWPIATIYL